MKMIHFTDTNGTEHDLNPDYFVQLTKSNWCTGGLRFHIYISCGDSSMYVSGKVEIDEETYADVRRQLTNKED